MGKSWEMMGNDGEIMRKSWENHGKVMGNDGEIMGKYGKIMGNVHEHHVASGEINENTIWENTYKKIILRLRIGTKNGENILEVKDGGMMGLNLD